MFAKFSPDGARVAYVRDNNIYVERLDDGKVTQLTTRRLRETAHHQWHVRLGLRRGARASATASAGARTARRSPTGSSTRTGVGIFSLINDTDTLYPVVTQIPYPKAGTTQFRRPRRRRRRRRRHRPTWIEDARRSAQQLPRDARVDRREHGRDPAAEPAAEPQRLPARRRHDRRRHARVPRRIEDLGRRHGARCRGSTTAARSCGSASATAGGTSIACRATAASRR